MHQLGHIISSFAIQWSEINKGKKKIQKKKKTVFQSSAHHNWYRISTFLYLKRICDGEFLVTTWFVMLRRWRHCRRIASGLFCLDWFSYNFIYKCVLYGINLLDCLSFFYIDFLIRKIMYFCWCWDWLLEKREF